MQFLLKLKRFICYKFLRLFTLSFISFFLFSQLAWSATYYVDATNGNNSNNGTSQSSPWKTISKVNSSGFNPGDQILFKRGETWREQLTIPSSGSSGNPITFGAYGNGERPTVNGSNIVTSWIACGTPSYSYQKAGITIEPKVAFYNGIQLTRTAGAGKNVGLNEWDWSSNTLYTNVGEDPGTKIFEVGQRDKCIYANEKNYIIFSSLLLEKGNQYLSAILCLSASTNVIVDNCEVRFGANSGIGVWNGSHNAVIQNCYIHNIGLASTAGTGSNIFVIDSNNAIIQSNILTYCGNNEHDHGIYPTGSTSGTIIRYNTFDNNRGAGVRNNATTTQVYYNIFKKTNIASSKCAFVSDAGNGNTFYNNIVYGGFGIGVETLPGQAGMDVKNNIFYGLEGRIFRFDDATGVTCNYNGFDEWKESKWGAGFYNTFAAWKTNTAQDANSVIGDPQFVNATGNDFHLSGSSPYINMGIRVGLTQDRDGNPVPQGAEPEIGAYEFLQKSPLSPPSNLKTLQQ